MSNSTTIVEGCLKYRYGKKWKARWAVITKLSPVADCLHLQIYRDSKDRCKNGPTKSSLSLDGFLGMETGFTLEKESNTIAIICKEIVVLLAFDSREVLIQWQVKIRTHLTEEQNFLVQITNLPPKTKLSCGPARLHLQDHVFCLVSGIPPRLLGFWPLKELRRFGVIDGKFCFEGGSQCGKGIGLHVLHTNQTEELSNCFELASKGKLHGKRRLSSNKNSSIDGSVRMSLQQTKCHKSCECGSNESSRPLISSSSESSVCDACSEIIRFNSSNFDNETSCDEQYSSRSTCCTILRCSSNLSSGGLPYISSASVAADNECFFTSSPSLAMLNNCTDNRRSTQGLSNIDSNTLPRITNDSNRCSWACSSCNRCGHHYCSQHNGCTDDVSLSDKTLPNNTISSINLSDLRSISPTSLRECLRHHNHQIINANKCVSILPDRASLCSQSSHSSGGSNSSNSSSSHSSGRCNCNNEYSVPRTQHKPHIILDMIYDRPKNIEHKICNIISKSEQMALCSCQMNQLDLNNRNVSFGHKFIPTGIRANNKSENCNDLSIMPLKDFNSVKCQRIEECNTAQHYSVPRTALAHIYLKELKQSQNSIADDMTQNIQNPFGEQYDVPRKYRDTLNQSCLCTCAMSTMTRRRNSSTSFESNNFNCDALPDINRMVNNRTLLSNNSYQTPVKAINQLMVSSHQTFDSCQQCSDLIGSQLLNPLGIKRVTISPQQSEFRTDKHFSLNSAVVNIPQTIVVNNVNGDKTSIIGEVEQQTKSSQSNAKPDFVNIDSVNKEQNMLTNCSLNSTSPQSINYVNMHFLESIAFYENIMYREGSNECNDNMIDRKVKDPMPSPSPLYYDKNQEHYEFMSFNDKNRERRKSIDSIESKSIDNYLLMQPIMTNECSLSNFESTQKSIVNSCDKPRIETMKSNDKKTNVGLCKSAFKTQRIHSGPVNEFKRKLSSFRQRSNSTEGRNRNYKHFSLSDTMSCPSSPSLNSKSCIENRRFFILSKLSYKSKEKSFSIDDISPEQLSFSRNHYFKFGQSIPFHKSADCLRQRADDYRSSEEDLCTGSQITVKDLCASPIMSSNFSGDKRPSNKIESTENCNSVGDTSANIIQPNEKSKDDKNLNDSLNLVDSTSSSDMSDYIETLSLSSRTSSGSDPTYVRCEDLTSKSLPINSISLKPRSKAEYLVESKNMIDCTTQLNKELSHLLHSPSSGYESQTSII